MTIGGRTRIALEREKALVLRSLKELEFDFAMGKMAQADFDEMSGRLRAPRAGIDAAARCRRRLQGTDRERELKARLSDGAASGSSRTPRKWHRNAKRRDVCGACDTQNDPDAKFCKNCGAKL